jgi:hypothetical protein
MIVRDGMVIDYFVGFPDIFSLKLDDLVDKCLYDSNA